jgi:hypothetical protein
MSEVIILGRGIGLLLGSYIYIVIQQRLLFLLCAILNIIAAVVYSIYFLLRKEKPAGRNRTLSNNIDVALEAGNSIY